MSDYVEAHPMKRDRVLYWFVALELLCVAVFLLLQEMGQSGLAAAVLLGPFQLLVWLFLAGAGHAAMLALAALAPLAAAELLPGFYQRYVLVPGTVSLLALLLLSRYISAGQPATPKIRTGERLSLLVLATWAVTSGVVAAMRGWGNHGLLLSTLLVVEVLLLTYFAAVIPSSLGEIRSILYTIIASMTLVAVWVPMAPSVSGGLTGKVVITPFGLSNLNVVASALAIIGAVALGLASNTKSMGPRLLMFSSVLLCVVALVITRSRGGWLGFGIAFLYVLHRSRSKGLLLLGAIAGLALLTSDLLRSMLVSRAADTNASDPAMFGRYMLWYFAWMMAKANLVFGVGMDNFRYVKHFYGYPLPLTLGLPYNAHNLYLEILVDLGVVGFASFFWLFLRAFAFSWRAARLGAARDVGLGLSAGLIACAVHGFFESNMFGLGVFILLGVLIGLGISLNRLTASMAVALRSHAE